MASIPDFTKDLDRAITNDLEKHWRIEERDMECEVYDKVWIMEQNKPSQKTVFAVVHSMSHFKNGVDVHYQLVDSKFGAGWGNNEGIRREPDEVYPSKAALLKSI